MSRKRSQSPPRKPAAPPTYVYGNTWNVPTFAVGEIGTAWSRLPVPVKENWNTLCLKLNAGSSSSGKGRQTGYTVFTQMCRAVRTVYGVSSLSDAPAAVAMPPSVGNVTVTATLENGSVRLRVSGQPYAGGVQAMASAPFVQGIRDPYSQRCAVVAALPDGWDENGADLSAGFTAKHGPVRLGSAIVVKLVPVSRDGFVGTAWCEVVVVTEGTRSSGTLAPPAPQAGRNEAPACLQAGTAEAPPAPQVWGATSRCIVLPQGGEEHAAKQHTPHREGGSPQSWGAGGASLTSNTARAPAGSGP